MDKASRAIRRSSIKLLSIGGGHSDINVMISEVKDIRNSAKAFMNAQNAASEDMVKWAANEENRAIQDVVNQLAELNRIWTEVQKDFVEHLKEYRHMFEMVLEGEKHITQSKTHLTACDQKETKIRKELKKAAKKAPADEIRILEARLAQAERAKDMAQIEVSDRIRENEAVKLIRIKDGLLKMSEAYIEMGKKCTTIFEAERDVSHQLPDVHGKDLEDIKYTGAGVTKYTVQKTKEKVQQYKRQSSHGYPGLPQNNEPPPPYSPHDSSLDGSHNSTGSFNVSSESSFHSPQGRLSLGASPRRLYPSPQVRQDMVDEDYDSGSADSVTGAMGGAVL